MGIFGIYSLSIFSLVRAVAAAEFTEENLPSMNRRYQVALNRFNKYFLNDNPVVTKTKVKSGKLPFIFNLKSVLCLGSKVQVNEIPGIPVNPFDYEYDENKDIPFYSNISEQALSSLF